jgi:hypothetical protein
MSPISVLLESEYKTINYYHSRDEDKSGVELLLLNFPVSRDIFKSELSLQVSYSDYFGDNLKFRMYCSPSLKSITYESFDDKTQIVDYECKSEMEYYKKKYLKYKQKYLKLKHI